MTDVPRHAREDRPSAASAGRDTPWRRWLGLSAVIGIAVAVALPFAPVRPRDRQAGGPGPQSAALTSAASLSATLGALGRVEASVAAMARTAAAAVMTATLREDDESFVPRDLPEPANFASPTECVRSYLPDVDVADGSLDSICSEADLWTIERQFAVRLAHRAGGAVRWSRLGSYSLAALASMRVGCCSAPEPLLAVVPGLWCGILRDKLRAFGPAPALPEMTDYEGILRCLAGRGMRFPANWPGVLDDRSRAAFQAFVRTARHRTKP